MFIVSGMAVCFKSMSGILYQEHPVMVSCRASFSKFLLVHDAFGIEFLRSILQTNQKFTGNTNSQMPLLILLSSSACSICGALAVLKFWVANHVTRLHCGISAKTVALDGVGSLLSAFCALSMVVGAVVYRRRRWLWFIDSALSSFAGLVMTAIGSRYG